MVAELPREDALGSGTAGAPDTVLRGDPVVSEPGGDTGAIHIRGVGAVVFDQAGRLLVVQRGHEPAKGRWSVPGGKVEAGESDVEAVRREILEETGLAVRVGALLGTVQRPGSAGVVYDIGDFDATVLGDPGLARSADDAADLRWVTRAELMALPVTDGLVEILAEWGRLPG